MPAIIDLGNSNKLKTDVGDYDTLIINNHIDVYSMLNEGKCKLCIPTENEAWNYMLKPGLIVNWSTPEFNSQTLVMVHAHNRTAGVLTIRLQIQMFL